MSRGTATSTVKGTRAPPHTRFTHGDLDLNIFILVKDIRVEKVIKHPQYGISQSTLAVNDLMLLKLSQPVEYNAWVRPACLPDL